jgi:putative pre-16S rRNA nuclease
MRLGRVLASPVPANSSFGYSLPVRVLAVDFGERRIGLATCDVSGQVVAARRTLLRRKDEDAVTDILRFCKVEEIEKIVLGIPRFPAGGESPFAARIRSFGGKLARATQIPIDYHEETLTSREAERAVAGRSHKTADVDSEAAAILLEDYLLDRQAGRS